MSKVEYVASIFVWAAWDESLSSGQSHLLCVNTSRDNVVLEHPLLAWGVLRCSACRHRRQGGGVLLYPLIVRFWFPKICWWIGILRRILDNSITYHSFVYTWYGRCCSTFAIGSTLAVEGFHGSSEECRASVKQALTLWLAWLSCWIFKLKRVWLEL